MQAKPNATALNKRSYTIRLAQIFIVLYFHECLMPYISLLCSITFLLPIPNILLLRIYLLLNSKNDKGNWQIEIIIYIASSWHFEPMSPQLSSQLFKMRNHIMNMLLSIYHAQKTYLIHLIDLFQTPLLWLGLLILPVNYIILLLHSWAWYCFSIVKPSSWPTKIPLESIIMINHADLLPYLASF